jgi:hypothetical protein
METVKTCSTCKETKPIGLFSRLARSKDGYLGRCKSCMTTKEKQWRETMSDETRVRVNEVQNKWREANPNRVKESQRKYYRKNKDVITTRIKKWKEENKDHVREVSRKWREENKEHFHALCKAWYENNKDRFRAKQKEWQKANPDKTNVYHQKWRSKNPAKVKAQLKRAQLKRIDLLTDTYIAAMVKNQIGNWGVEVPPELIAIKRQHLLIKRKLKEINDEKHN